jgi:hypothetical protein
MLTWLISRRRERRAGRWRHTMRERGRLAAAWTGLVAAIAIGACGAASGGQITAGSAAAPATWDTFVHIRVPIDVVVSDRIVVAANGRLRSVSPGGAVAGFATAYRSPGGGEPYLAASPGGCFGQRTLYVLQVVGRAGVMAVNPQGRVRRFASIGAPGLLDGIAFDTTGRFGHRLLVMVTAGTRTTVDAIGCDGRVTRITRDAPRVEGGVAVAPASFGRFAGDLIAPDEISGKVFAITPSGRGLLIANPGLQHGQDIGVESEAFVPTGNKDALLADRLTPGNPHPGDDVILRIRAAALRSAGVRAGDLLVASEGGALTDAIRCTTRACTAREVAAGPAIAHAEGHIAFAATR